MNNDLCRNDIAMEKVIFDQVVKVGCGIDVHKDNIVATVRKSEEDFETKEFSSFTSSLTELREWCKLEGVTHIAMESTGVYWKPVFNILEEGDFEIILVNARHVRNVPGHKTDKKDSQWLSKLLLSGLLKASFIPPIEIRDLRDLVRYKKKVTAQASSEKNRIIRILEDANIKLSSVLTNVDGAVGSRIIDDLIAGKTKPVQQTKNNILQLDRENQKKKNNLAILLWVNTVLDVFYTISGLRLIRSRGASNPFWRGQGVGITVQGGFLFLFDLVHARWLSNRRL